MIKKFSKKNQNCRSYFKLQIKNFSNDDQKQDMDYILLFRTKSKRSGFLEKWRKEVSSSCDRNSKRFCRVLRLNQLAIIWWYCKYKNLPIKILLYIKFTMSLKSLPAFFEKPLVAIVFASLTKEGWIRKWLVGSLCCEEPAP